MIKPNEIVISTTDEYIAAHPPEIQEILQKVRETIQEAAPDASEGISYQMPAFRQDENLIYYAAMKRHLGIYPTGSPMQAEEFRERIQVLDHSKGCIRFSWKKPIDYDLIRDLTRFRVKEVLEKRAKK